MGSKHGNLKPNSGTTTQHNRPIHTSTKRAEGVSAESTHPPKQNQQLHLQELTKSTTTPSNLHTPRNQAKIELDLEATGVETSEITQGEGDKNKQPRQLGIKEKIKLQRGASPERHEHNEIASSSPPLKCSPSRSLPVSADSNSTARMRNGEGKDAEKFQKKKGKRKPHPTGGGKTGWTETNRAPDKKNRPKTTTASANLNA